MKQLMLGNAAVARGLYEAGCCVISSYPGTPSTEITEEAVKYNEIYCEWAPNEKVAMETAFGACLAGKRAFCAMKHVGLNVAADPLYTMSYTGVNAGLVIGVGTPMFAYEVVDGNTVLSGSRMTFIAGVFGVFAIICYLLCFKLVRERVEVPANNAKLNIGKLLGSLVTNRSLLGIIAAAIALLLAMLTMQGMAGYVFPNYYGNATAQSMSSLAGTAAMLVICAPFASKLSAKYGKKELSVVSCVAAAVVYLVCLIVHPSNAFVYVGFFTVAYIGLGFFNTVIWAMITDVIDDAEVKNGVREDGTIYSVYSFARKLGQALSAGLTGSLLTMIGYSNATAFDPEVTERIFMLSCIAPIIGFTLVAVFLIVIYPLNKKRVEENVAVLAARRNK